ncbi:LytTR family DNA-binding domain-containing protein [Flavobacterium sp. CBA20B-1]|uniref:LytR/AlgR family response regulator transcription factor n=1 Tax=unclassified Flavobacterium TaxID=196869 RepID=UPI0022242E73|nr:MULTISPECIES: LytTR family DNA-binding domain-containing protein [unclassified Flavobacterium]WCM41923.1 LytTR family DNA-binding domain-containing protein [Flavobacterium sp. CBA20B-1]
MIKTIIIENEPAILKEIEWLVNKEDDLELVGNAGTVFGAMELIRKEQPDLALMDIQLTDGTVFDVLKSLTDINFQIIFITAYNHFAIKAIKFGAMDYLLKPLDENELQSALEKVRDKQFDQLKQQQQLSIAQQKIEKEELGLDDQIVLHTIEYLQVLQLNEIIYLKSEGSYTNFLLTNNRKIMVSKPLKYYQDLLPEKWFLRPHQSYLVNTTCIDRYIKTGYIILKDTTQIPVSVRKKEAVVQHLTQGQ